MARKVPLSKLCKIHGQTLQSQMPVLACTCREAESHKPLPKMCCVLRSNFKETWQASEDQQLSDFVCPKA